MAAHDVNCFFQTKAYLSYSCPVFVRGFLGQSRRTRLLSTLLKRNTHTSSKFKRVQLGPFCPGCLLGLYVHAYPHFHVILDEACDLMLFLGCSSPWRELFLSILDCETSSSRPGPPLSTGGCVVYSFALWVPPSAPSEVALTTNPVVAVAMPDLVCSVPSLGICPPLLAICSRIVHTSSREESRISSISKFLEQRESKR